MDKYEEFKKWFTIKQDEYEFKSTEVCYKIGMAEVDNAFEKYYKEKQQDDKIKSIIHDTLVRTTTTLEFNAGFEPATEIFNMLKKEGYLKYKY